jgi:hypothetical protein
MEKQSFWNSIEQAAGIDPQPRLSIGLIDRNRINLDKWSCADDCLIGHWPNGKPRYLIPKTQIVMVEIIYE